MEVYAKESNSETAFQWNNCFKNLFRLKFISLITSMLSESAVKPFQTFKLKRRLNAEVQRFNSQTFSLFRHVDALMFCKPFCRTNCSMTNRSVNHPNQRGRLFECLGIEDELNVSNLKPESVAILLNPFSKLRVKERDENWKTI